MFFAILTAIFGNLCLKFRLLKYQVQTVKAGHNHLGYKAYLLW